MTEDEVVATAIQLATTYHAGQVDKSGRPYLGHCERVANMVNSSGGGWHQVAAAWLHDIVEDTTMTFDVLEKIMPGTVVQTVRLLTHENGVANEDYWGAIAENRFATLVKVCDIYDNLDPRRMCYLDEDKQKRLRAKYGRALQVLAGA